MANAWFQVAATYDGQKTRLYIDGELERTVAAQSTPRSILGDLIIGAVKHGDVFENHLIAVLDELRLWNLPLAIGNIQAGMFAALAGTETGLVAYYPLNEGTGQAAGDASGHGNAGILGPTSFAEGQDPTWVLSDRPTAIPIAKRLADEAQADQAVLPLVFALEQNYPNPFNAGTMIRFHVPQTSHSEALVTISLYDLQGRLIRKLAQGTHTAGIHQVFWNGRTENDQPVASGVYIYRMDAGDFIAHKRMVLLK